VLRGDGFGVVSFGDPMDDVMTTLANLLGPPSSDELVESPRGEGSYFRMVRWWSPSLKLYLEFINWDINYAPLDTAVFSYWAAGRSEIPLRTAEGVGPGTLWTDATEIYRDRVQASPEDCEGRRWWNFRIDQRVVT
jgi:hypothetical protein